MKSYIIAFLLAVAVGFVAGCGGEDEKKPTEPDNGTTRRFTWYGTTREIPCTTEAMNQYCVTRGYHEAIDWQCANTPSGFMANEITCWKP